MNETEYHGYTPIQCMPPERVIILRKVAEKYGIQVNVIAGPGNEYCDGCDHVFQRIPSKYIAVQMRWDINNRPKGVPRELYETVNRKFSPNGHNPVYMHGRPMPAAHDADPLLV